MATSLALVMLVAGLPWGASPAYACADISQPILNFKVEAKWEKPNAKVGSVAKMKIFVTRTADQDPVTLAPYPTGRPMEEPVSDVSIGVGLLVDDVFLAAGAMTDAEGRAVIKVPIERYVKPGTGISRVFAKKDITPPDFPSSSCRVVVYEYGVLQPGPEIKITRG